MRKDRAAKTMETTNREKEDWKDRREKKTERENTRVGKQKRRKIYV